MEKEKVVTGCRAETEDKKEGWDRPEVQREKESRSRTTEKEGDLENNRGRGIGRKKQKN